jgi:hypothetical protein
VLVLIVLWVPGKSAARANYGREAEAAPAWFADVSGMAAAACSAAATASTAAGVALIEKKIDDHQHECGDTENPGKQILSHGRSLNWVVTPG